MRTKGFILALAALFLLPLSTEAQLGSKLKKKFEETVNKALEKENSGEETDTTDNQQAEESQFDLSKFGIGKVTASYEDNYSFKGMIRMKSDIYDKGKTNETVEIDIWFDAGNSNLGMESQTITDDEGGSVKATSIIDAKNKVMIVISEASGTKSGIIMLVPDSLDTDEENASSSDVTIRKTGEKRTICGYRCEKYEVTENNGKMVSNVWATNELKIDGSQELFGDQEGMPRGMGKIKGVIMASETYENGTLTSSSEVTKVDLNAKHSISTAGVSLMQMDMGKWSKKKK